MHKNKSGKMVIVDEGVSDSQLTRFKRFTEDSGLIIIDYQLVRLLHPGMPDGQILLHLLREMVFTILPFKATPLNLPSG